jgi:hypothetical protein
LLASAQQQWVDIRRYRRKTSHRSMGTVLRHPENAALLAGLLGTRFATDKTLDVNP